MDDVENAAPDTQRRLVLGGRTFLLVGTAHVSAQSIREVAEAIEAERPDTVAIELDEKRRQNLEDPEAWRKMDVIKVLRDKQGFLMVANIVLSSYQKRMGAGAGVRPGDEMVAALAKARELGIPCEMVDRPIAVTLRRAWARSGFWGKCKLLSALIASAFGGGDEIAPQDIEGLKKRSEMDSMMAELSSYLPAVKEVLIDERDRYLAAHVWGSSGNTVLAVLGAGHLPGVAAHLERIAAGQESPDCSGIDAVPGRTLAGKLALWVVPALIVAVIAAGFAFGGRQKGWNMLGSWVLWNGALAGIGALLAGGHPITVLVSIIGAPLTSLCPFIGIGIVSGIVQAVMRRPTVADMEGMQADAASVWGFYRNRILRVLLVFVLSSLGSSIGTFAAGAGFVVAVSTFFGNIVDFVKGLLAR